MRFDLQFFRSATGQLVLVGLLATVAITTVARHRNQRTADLPPSGVSSAAVSLPTVFQRAGAKFIVPVASPTDTAIALELEVTSPAILPLNIVMHHREVPIGVDYPVISFGRMIPCETVFSLESSRLDTPLIALVTEDVWMRGSLIIPSGTEVHGHGILDQANERISAQGKWTLIRPEQSALQIEGIALEQMNDGTLDHHDVAAGLTGAVLRTGRAKETKLFAATFMATATAALQTTQPNSGLFGTVTPAATARNATLAGTSAVAKDYAEQLRDAVAKDGIYIRVPAGHRFYLYVTESVPNPTNTTKEVASL